MGVGERRIQDVSVDKETGEGTRKEYFGSRGEGDSAVSAKLYGGKKESHVGKKNQYNKRGRIGGLKKSVESRLR